MFIDELIARTEPERRLLFSLPIIQRALHGDVTRANYVEFLTQAYHHVRHTVPLLMACGSRLPERLGWLTSSIISYIEEEAGHEEWVLNDIAAAGGDPEAVRYGKPGYATDVLVAYAYDATQRRNPLCFFGMAHVLEGTSVQLATRAAVSIRTALGLPESAFRYLASHGEVDIEHTRTFARLVNRFDTDSDREAVVGATKVFYRLYADIFRNLGEVAS
jgi:heme oxygenase